MAQTALQGSVFRSDVSYEAKNAEAPEGKLSGAFVCTKQVSHRDLISVDLHNHFAKAFAKQQIIQCSGCIFQTVNDLLGILHFSLGQPR